MKKFVAICAVIAMGVAVAPSFGDMTVYTNEASFTSHLQSGYYLEDFDYAPWTTIVDPAITSPKSFTQGPWTYAISSPSGLSGQPIPPDGSGTGGAVANYYIGQALTITFDDTMLPRAIGGIFWATDVHGNFLNGQTVTVTLKNGGTYTYSDSSNWDAFTGFISDSPIQSLSLQTSNFATMDHLYVGSPVPVPGAVLLGMLGLGYAGRKLRRYS